MHYGSWAATLKKYGHRRNHSFRAICALLQHGLRLNSPSNDNTFYKQGNACGTGPLYPDPFFSVLVEPSDSCNSGLVQIRHFRMNFHQNHNQSCSPLRQCLKACFVDLNYDWALGASAICVFSHLLSSSIKISNKRNIIATAGCFWHCGGKISWIRVISDVQLRFQKQFSGIVPAPVCS